MALFLETGLFNCVKTEVIFTTPESFPSISRCLTFNKFWKHSAHILSFKEYAACVNFNKSGEVL